jgi:hypothetical protein
MNSKIKVVKAYLDHCERNGIVVTQAELQRLYAVPFTYLKRIVAEKMQNAVVA